MELIDKMVHYRAVNNITQKELAKRCNVSVQTVNSIENGYQTPSKVTAEKIMIIVGGNDNE